MKKIFSLSILLILCFLLNAQNQLVNPFPKTISVTGSAEMDVIPDEIYVQIDLKEYKKKGEKIELENIKTNFLNTCKTMGIADSLISIVAYEGYNYNYWNWRKRKKDPDMLAAISYQVKFKDSKKIDDLIDHLDDEATSNFQIVRTSHSRIQEFRKQLKIQAVKAAKDKAIYLTEPIGEKLGEAITITEPDDNSVYYFALDKPSNTVLKEKAYQDRYSNNGDAAIDFKKIKLKYDVKILFALK
jgi:uncharacterized protein YggE